MYQSFICSIILLKMNIKIKVAVCYQNQNVRFCIEKMTHSISLCICARMCIVSIYYRMCIILIVKMKNNEHIHMMLFIRWLRKFLRFFDIFFFIFFSFLRGPAINCVRTVGIYDSSPTIQEGKDAALIKVYRPLGKKSGGVDFQVLLFVELLSTQIVGERPKEVIFCQSQVWRIRWKGNGYSNQLH